MKKILLLVVVLATSLSLLAQGRRNGIESVAFPNAVISQDATQVAGNSLVGGSAAWNPVLALLSPKRFNAVASYQGFAPASVLCTDNAALGLAVRIGKAFSVSANFSNAWGQSYDLRDPNNKYLDTFVPQDMIAGMGLSFRPMDWLMFGAQGNYLRSSFSPEVSYQMILANIMMGLTFGDFTAILAGKNLGANVQMDAGDFYPPTAFSAGVLYDKGIGESCALKAHAEADYYIYKAARAGVGVDFSWADMLAVRVGYNQSFDAPLSSFLSLGIAAGYAGVAVNASYLISPGLINSTLLFGLSLAL